MAGVWGRGGLFEQAVQQKYANQGMNAATDRMNADTNRMKAGNDLTLGLRGADIEQMNANTNRFNADTTRADLAVRNPGSGGLSATKIAGYGLGNSFTPDTNAYRTDTASRPTSYFSGTSSSGTSTFGDSASNLQTFGVGNPEEKKFGFRNSGVVMKPRMVRQPGYKNSGKVMGYADSGAAKDPAVIPDKYSEIRQQISELAKQGDIDGATDLRMKLEAMESGRVKPGYSNSGKVWPGVDPAAPVVKTPREIMDEQFRRNVEASRTGGDMQQFLKAPRVPVKLFENGGSAEEGGLRSPKSFGPIGDVEDDTGRDTIDAKVRPGEYLLNPETVENGFGDGDYDKGVRRLDNIVRRATGKEPGPTMVADSKLGFEDSGGTDKFWRDRARAQQQAAEQSARDAQRGVFTADDKGNVSTEPPKPATPTERVSRGYRNVINSGTAAGQATRRGIEATKTAVANAKNALVKAPGPIATAAGATLNVVGKRDYYGDSEVPFTDKFRQGLRDAVIPVATGAGTTFGAALGGAGGLGVGSIPGSVVGGAAGGAGGAKAGGWLLDQLGGPETEEYQQWQAAQQAAEQAAQQAKQQPAPATSAAAPVQQTEEFPPIEEGAPSTVSSGNGGTMSFMRDVASGGAPTTERQPSLRDFLESQYRTLATQGGADDGLWRQEQMKNIGAMLNNMDQTSATALNAQLEYGSKMDKAARDNRKEVVDAAASALSIKQVDPETGKISFVKDPEKLSRFEQEYPGALDMAERYGVKSVMPIIEEFNARDRATQKVNAQLNRASGGVRSDKPLKPEEIGAVDDITFVDTVLPTWLGGDSNYSGGLRDWWRGADFGMYDNYKDKRVKVRGQTMSLAELLQDADGNIDAGIANQFPNLQPYLITK